MSDWRALQRQREKRAAAKASTTKVPLAVEFRIDFNMAAHSRRPCSVRGRIKCRGLARTVSARKSLRMRWTGLNETQQSGASARTADTARRGLSIFDGLSGRQLYA